MKNPIVNNVEDKNIPPEIIDDVGLVHCINQLNSLKEASNQPEEHFFVPSNTNQLGNVDSIHYEMRWFSQWLTAKMRRVAA